MNANQTSSTKQIMLSFFADNNDRLYGHEHEQDPENEEYNTLQGKTANLMSVTFPDFYLFILYFFLAWKIYFK